MFYSTLHLCSSTLIVLLCVLCRMWPIDCFGTIPGQHITSYTKTLGSRSQYLSPSSLLMASDNGRGSSDGKTSLRDRLELPPTPEDFIVLGGDVAALFTYTFLDRAITSFAIFESRPSFTEPDAFLVPVWSDVSSQNFGESFLSAVLSEQQLAQIGQNPSAAAVAMDLQNIHHAPCLESFGLTAVLLVSCWLVSGYFNKAFLFQNTISCAPSHAIVVTGKTWLLTAAMMVGLACWSGFCFCPNHTVSLSKTDAEFIFDTFTVLVTWRYMVSLVLGQFM